MTSKRIAITLLVATFLLGLLLGNLTHDWISPDHKRHRKHPSTEETIAMFTKELQLSQAQQEKLELLLTELQDSLNALRRQRISDYIKARTKFETKFSEYLSEEQRKKFDEFNEKFKKRKK
ncbi:periplasmic heavy metal sensor [candidate division KSB1 bacterium]|nr:periplasmic heavy metal sensor [candidate division KSB1 bacterium]